MCCRRHSRQLILHEHSAKCATYSLLLLYFSNLHMNVRICFCGLFICMCLCVCARTVALSLAAAFGELVPMSSTGRHITPQLIGTDTQTCASTCAEPLLRAQQRADTSPMRIYAWAASVYSHNVLCMIKRHTYDRIYRVRTRKPERPSQLLGR